MMWVLITVLVGSTNYPLQVGAYVDGIFPNQENCELDIARRKQENMQGNFYCLYVSKDNHGVHHDL